MSNDILKKAALAALEAELKQLPSEHRLSLQYNFSEEFEAKMEHLISENRSKYFSVFGKFFSRRVFTFLLYILITIISLWLFFSDTVGIHTARIIWLSSITAVAIIFKSNIHTDSYNSQYTKDFERKFRPAFLDANRSQSYWDNSPETDYTLPLAPPGFVLKDEYRTASKHIADYADTYGNTVHYVRNSLKEIIDFVDADTVDIINTTINGYPAIEYSEDGENHLLWEDRFFQYHYHGKVSTDILRSFTKNPK